MLLQSWSFHSEASAIKNIEARPMLDTFLQNQKTVRPSSPPLTPPKGRGILILEFNVECLSWCDRELSIAA